MGEAGHHGHGHEKHSYHIFHVDFERVEIPFIIALWIFVSSLAKIGNNTHKDTNTKYTNTHTHTYYSVCAFV